MGLRWSHDEEQELANNIRNGLTAGQIAIKMDMTRNMVIGKAWRMGLSIGRHNRPIYPATDVSRETNRSTRIH